MNFYYLWRNRELQIAMDETRSTSEDGLRPNEYIPKLAKYTVRQSYNALFGLSIQENSPLIAAVVIVPRMGACLRSRKGPLKLLPGTSCSLAPLLNGIGGVYHPNLRDLKAGQGQQLWEVYPAY